MVLQSIWCLDYIAIIDIKGPKLRQNQHNIKIIRLIKGPTAGWNSSSPNCWFLEILNTDKMHPFPEAIFPANLTHTSLLIPLLMEFGYVMFMTIQWIYPSAFVAVHSFLIVCISRNQYEFWLAYPLEDPKLLLVQKHKIQIFSSQKPFLYNQVWYRSPIACMEWNKQNT